MKRAALGVLIWLVATAGSSAGAQLTVDFVNASRTTLCAEEDNVYVKLLGQGVGSLRISAEHPPYIGSVTEDSTAPDFTRCDMSGDPSFAFVPRTVVLHEDEAMRLVGHTYASFWRPEVVDFRVGNRNERGLHLVQLLRRGPARDVEILVVYPSDGYWRLKPLPPPALADSAYGSSFLFGPIEEGERPFVSIRSIVFEPATMTFRLHFRDGSAGVLTVASATRERTSLSLALDPPVAVGRPFAALRSMFVSTDQADVALASWATEPAGQASAPVLAFGQFRARAARFGRVEPSRHNLSAPDLVFDAFSAASRPQD